MKKTRKFFMLVIDEYGGLAGIVTMNDLLEQLVGDLDDDDSAEPVHPLITSLGADNDGRHSWRINGSASLDRVERALGVDLPNEQYDTFGGYVWALLGIIPEDGWTGEIEDGRLHIKVEKVEDRRLEEASVVVSEG
jgi:putative hemolysin